MSLKTVQAAKAKAVEKFGKCIALELELSKKGITPSTSEKFKKANGEWKLAHTEWRKANREYARENRLLGRPS